MITVFGNLRSRALRPLWLLRELGAPFEWVPVIQGYRIPNPDAPTAPYNTTAPTFRAINPMGQVPAMTDGDFVLTESVAITLYLARKFGGPMAPANPAEDAQALQWAVFAVSAIEGPALDILLAHNRDDPATAQSTIATARAALARPFARLEAHLTDRNFLIGARFTVADILVAECARFAIDDAALFARFPAVNRWLTAARARPVFQTLWAERNAEPESVA